MKVLRSIPGSFWFRIETTTQRGVPDALGLVRGIFVGVEFKSSSKAKVTELQKFMLENISSCGGIALLLHPDNFSENYQGLLHFAETGDIITVEKGDTPYN